MATVPSDPIIEEAFAKAARDFKSKLADDKLYNDLLKTKTIDEVYDAAEALQNEQGKTGRLRNLKRIGPFLEKLREYSDVINVFVQAKPDVLALIWGPIRLILQLASSLERSVDALMQTTKEIGNLLPEFKEMTVLFDKNPVIKDVLVLFFEDILEFYVVALKFFSLSKLRYLFEALWPTQREKIKIVMEHIERRKTSLRSEVRLEQIRGDREAKQRALEHFELTEKTKRSQEFNRVMTSLKPTHYYHDLDRIWGKTYAGTGEWLLKDNQFTKWLDVTDASSNLLWLQGIPGAGKTFLASIVTKRAASLHPTAFAFLSHVHSANTSALSVIHSMISQIASDDENLQSIVCQSATNKLRSDLDCAAQLLQDLISCVGPTYFIIDGLDEVDKTERRRLLEKLVSLSKMAQECRILILSRAEDDISRILDPLASRIRVDACNSSSIQAYIDQWTQNWFQERDFFPECRDEIISLLNPLSAKAKGMFLYVRIMLANIERLSEMEEIRSELRVLPETLEDAYGRILRQINSNQSIATRTKCRSLLGWICCSPTPLTLKELEQAYVVYASSTGACRVSSSLRIVELCGPIIELIGEYVHVVHFTVKEYLNSPTINNSIDCIESKLSLALCILKYLCQSHHDLDIIKNEDLKARVMAGDYRLHHYATERWLELVVSYLRDVKQNEISVDLIDLLSKLMDERGNTYFDSGTALDELWYPPELHKLEAGTPEIFVLLQNAARYLQKCTTSQFQVNNSQPWATLDPLTTSYTSQIFQEALEAFLCLDNHHSSDCVCMDLHRQYGSYIYKCNYIYCPDRRSGFETRALRSSHEKSHNRPWKCDVPSCHYAKHGFLTQRMRLEHEETHRDSGIVSADALQVSLDKAEVESLCFDLVYSNDTARVIELLNIHELSYHKMRELIRTAAYSGTKEMLSLLTSVHPDHYKETITNSIRGDNKETLEWLLSKIEEGDRGVVNSRLYDSFPEAITTRSLDIRQTYFSRIMEIANSIVTRRGYTEAISFLSKGAIIATAHDPIREELLLSVWSALVGPLINTEGGFVKLRRPLQAVLGYIADTTCSINLAKIILGYGVDVNRRYSTVSRTPLYRACEKSSLEAAKFSEWLLYQGADPDIEIHIIGSEGFRPAITELEGAKNIVHWLGITWEELVTKVNADRGQE